MTPDRTLEQLISDWLVEEAPGQLPDRVLEATFAQTRALRRARPSLPWRFPVMNRFGATVVAGGAAVLVVALGLAWSLRTTPGPAASPTRETPLPSASSPSPSASLTPISLTGEVVFGQAVDGNADLYLAHLDRSGVVRLTSDPAYDQGPAWSPDGSRIVFSRGQGPGGGLFIMNADGSDQRRLTESALDDGFAQFSPDGTTIAYWSGVELRSIRPDGSGDRLLARFDEFTGHLAWSPDGRAIYFNHDPSATGGEIDIARIDLATKAVVDVIARPRDDSTFALSPDGTQIAFQSDREPGGIWIAGSDGSAPEHIVGSWGKGHTVAWSSDGERLMYWDPNDLWLHLIKTDRSDNTRWLPSGDSGVAWRPAP